MNPYTNAAVALALAVMLNTRTECLPLETFFTGENSADQAVRFEDSAAWNKYRRRRITGDTYRGQKGGRGRRCKS